MARWPGDGHAKARSHKLHLVSHMERPNAGAQALGPSSAAFWGRQSAAGSEEEQLAHELCPHGCQHHRQRLYALCHGTNLSIFFVCLFFGSDSIKKELSLFSAYLYQSVHLDSVIQWTAFLYYYLYWCSDCQKLAQWELLQPGYHVFNKIPSSSECSFCFGIVRCPRFVIVSETAVSEDLHWF